MVMAHVTAGVEYGLHGPLDLSDMLEQVCPASVRGLADLQSVRNVDFAVRIA
jgi:hypothetical protein